MWPNATKTICFTEPAEVDYLDGSGRQTYAEGSTHTLRADKADRWIRRNKAVEVKLEEVLDTPPPAPPAGAQAPAEVPPPAPVPAPGAPAAAATAAAAPGKPEAPADGNTVAGATALAGQDSGGAGQRPVNVPARGRSGPRS